jgi:hypothetical protein
LPEYSYFVWWQEKDASVITQVVDFEKGVVQTTWTSPEKELIAFEGTVVSTREARVRINNWR